nr:MAG TPA: hypothetical protein [Caudoviricetes sp.]
MPTCRTNSPAFRIRWEPPNMRRWRTPNTFA